MQTILTRLWLLALLGVASNACAVHDASPCRTNDVSAECRYAKGLLWKIEPAGARPSYLFGTIHLSDPRVTSLPVPVRNRFNAASSFVMETLLDADGIAQMQQAISLGEGRTLESILGAPRYARVQQALEHRGSPLLAAANGLKPWFIATTLAAPAQEQAVLDIRLARLATAQHKPVHGLETMREQINVFDGLALDDQIALLDEALAQLPELDRQVEELVRAYVARDLRRIGTIMRQQELKDARLDRLVTARLLTDRNHVMLERLRPRLREGNAFIAVGAAHLSGEQGLLSLLEQAGYRVSPVF